MSPIADPRCRCAYCTAPIDPAEARATAEILARFNEEAFWDAIAALGPPCHGHDVPCELGVARPACLDCLTGALFSLAVAPGGRAMLG